MQARWAKARILKTARYPRITVRQAARRCGPAVSQQAMADLQRSVLIQRFGRAQGGGCRLAKGVTASGGDGLWGGGGAGSMRAVHAEKG